MEAKLRVVFTFKIFKWLLRRRFVKILLNYGEDNFVVSLLAVGLFAVVSGVVMISIDETRHIYNGIYSGFLTNDIVFWSMFAFIVSLIIDVIMFCLFCFDLAVVEYYDRYIKKH